MALQQIRVSLHNPGGELDVEIIAANTSMDDTEISHLIEDAIGNWTLSVGDTIKIEEVQ